MDIHIPLGILVILLSSVPYIPILIVGNVPLYDDAIVIARMLDSVKLSGGMWKFFWSRIKQLHRREGLRTRALAWVTIPINSKIGSEKAWLLLNLLIHAAFSIVLFQIALTFFEPWVALIAAIAAAWHPGSVMAVTQVVLGRPSMLCAVFILSAVWCMVIGLPWLVLPLAVLGFLSKEEVWVMPVVVLLTSLALL